MSAKLWVVEYDNDTGPNDDCFWEYWDIVNTATGARFRSRERADALWLCDLLNNTI